MRTIVVGASSGLGRCITVDFARRGDAVGCVLRNGAAVPSLTIAPRPRA